MDMLTFTISKNLPNPDNYRDRFGAAKIGS
jgi:hypothetical protein